VRKNRLTLDQSGIAVRRFLTRRPSVNQHHVLATLLQMRGDRNPDHSRAENHYIGLHLANLPQLGGVRTGRLPPAGQRTAFCSR
jgi:hypothetical protein